MRIDVDYNRCDSNAVCTDIAPEIFELDDDDQLHVRHDAPLDAHRQGAELAAASCPKLAITISED